MSDRPPSMLTVVEAAQHLRIGRTKAYALAHQYLVTDGKAGLPVIDFGDVLRVPRHQLEELIGGPLDGGGRDGSAAEGSPTTEPIDTDPTSVNPAATNTGDDGAASARTRRPGAASSASADEPTREPEPVATTRRSNRRDKNRQRDDQLDLFNPDAND